MPVSPFPMEQEELGCILGQRLVEGAVVELDHQMSLRIPIVEFTAEPEVGQDGRMLKIRWSICRQIRC